MIIFFGLVSGLTIFYAWLMWRYRLGWQKLPVWSVPTDWKPSTKVSILIPVRNEEDNIKACIDSIIEQDYPNHLYELIILDDFSTDRTPQIVRSYSNKNVKLLQLADFISAEETQSFKKKALSIGVEHSTGELIMTTDGDCIASKSWLNHILSFYDSHAYQFIAAPVQFHQEQSTFECFQSLDFAGMMIVTGGGIQSGLMNMCNGANLAYTRSAFEAVNGYEGINQKASGDDMMLMQKIAKLQPNNIGFLKNNAASTFTLPKPTVASFFNQRVRWTTKAGNYQEKQVTLFLGLVWLFCLSIPVVFLSTLFIGWIGIGIGILLLIIKGMVDYFLLNTAAHFFNREDLMKTFLTSSVYHLIYIITVGFWGNIPQKYEWKGRKVR